MASYCRWREGDGKNVCYENGKKRYRKANWNLQGGKRGGMTGKKKVERGGGIKEINGR
jgi:hypothetical protein